MRRVLPSFVEGALSNSAFTTAFAAAAAPFIRVGERKSLVQLGLKLFAPGVPDIYQGTEFADLSLVDPDNRRPVDFDARLRVSGRAPPTACRTLAGERWNSSASGWRRAGNGPSSSSRTIKAIPAGTRMIGFARRHGRALLAIHRRAFGPGNARRCRRLKARSSRLIHSANDNAAITIAISETISEQNRN